MVGKRKGLWMLEWRRLAGFRGLYLFAVFCIIVNALQFWDLARTPVPGQVEYVSEAIGAAGTARMGEDWDNGILSLPHSAWKTSLIKDTAGKTDIFEGYEAAHIFGLLDEGQSLHFSGAVRKLMKEKYEKLQAAVERLAERDTSLDVFAASLTPYVAGSAQSLAQAFILEGFILAVLIVCYLTGYDRLSGTEGVICATRTGRRLRRARFAAGLLHLLCLMAVIGIAAVFSLRICLDVSRMWDAGMSTQFLGRLVGAEFVPVITWVPMTFREYMLAAAALGLVLVLGIYMLAFGIGLLAGNSYAVFLGAAAAFALNMALVSYSRDEHLWTVFELAQWLPFSAWKVMPFWFTDMLEHALIPWQEIWETVWVLALAAASIALCGKAHERKGV